MSIVEIPDGSAMTSHSEDSLVAKKPFKQKFDNKPFNDEFLKKFWALQIKIVAKSQSEKVKRVSQEGQCQG